MFWKHSCTPARRDDGTHEPKARLSLRTAAPDWRGLSLAMSIDATAARKKLQGTMPAPHEQAVAIASTLSASMVLLYPEARTKGVYFELFRRMDPLRRNCIKFHEFVDMVRIGLRCSVARLDDLSLRMFWRAGDTDSKGTITLGAFVKLMSLGWRGFTDEQEHGGGVFPLVCSDCAAQEPTRLVRNRMARLPIFHHRQRRRRLPSTATTPATPTEVAAGISPCHPSCRSTHHHRSHRCT